MTATALLLFAAAAAANLLTNPDFSAWDNPNQPTGWAVEDTTKALIEQSSDPFRSPAFSARQTRMVDSTGNNKGLSQTVSVVPGAAYTVAAWCFDEDPLVKGGVSITWRKSDTSYIANSGVANSDSGLTGWQKLVKTDTAPAEAGLADILLRIYNMSGSTPAGGKVFYDDAEFDTGYGAIVEQKPGHRPTTPVLRFRPNPASGPGFVSLTLPCATRVELAVHNVAGSVVAELHRGRLEPGVHQFRFTGTNHAGEPLPTGLYFLALTWGSGSSTVRKIVLQP
jgi:hypothetical protein